MDMTWDTVYFSVFLWKLDLRVGKNPGRYFDLCVYSYFFCQYGRWHQCSVKIYIYSERVLPQKGWKKKKSKLYLDTMFSEYNGHHVPPHYGGPHGPPPPHHHGGHMPPTGHHHPMAGPPQSYSPYMRPRMDPTSDVFTCLFGDLFVKWWVLAKSSFVWWAE